MCAPGGIVLSGYILRGNPRHQEKKKSRRIWFREIERNLGEREAIGRPLRVGQPSWCIYTGEIFST